jgi:hypothetical protein
MRITVKHGLGQLSHFPIFSRETFSRIEGAKKLKFLLLFCVISMCSCGIRREEGPVVPPVTSPLSRNYIGYGVITASFTHITADPAEDSPSLGILRRGSLVRVIRRQTVRTARGFTSWVLIDDHQHGWLKEEVMNIYNSESQARTASESVFR